MTSCLNCDYPYADKDVKFCSQECEDEHKTLSKREIKYLVKDVLRLLNIKKPTESHKYQLKGIERTLKENKFSELKEK